jgi:hypothetical protein
MAKTKRSSRAAKPRPSNVDDSKAAEQIGARSPNVAKRRDENLAQIIRQNGPAFEQQSRLHERARELEAAVEARHLDRLAQHGLKDSGRVSADSPGFIPAGDPRQKIYDELLLLYRDDWQAMLDILSIEFPGSEEAPPKERRGAWKRNGLWKSWRADGLTIPEIRNRWNAMPDAERLRYKPFHHKIGTGKSGWEVVAKGIKAATKTAGAVAESS